jgi:hypothetical protein
MPECRVPARGSSEHGFPLLSGAGRLVFKEAVMAGAALVTMVDSAKACLWWSCFVNAKRHQVPDHDEAVQTLGAGLASLARVATSFSYRGDRPLEESHGDHACGAGLSPQGAL